LCDYSKDEIVIIIAKRLSPNNVVRTLFHELVHVKQHSEGRLEYGNIWLGEKVESTYENLPWEQEAFEIEQKMMDVFFC
jgi:Zn-dependent peptidase ImmA (M78 family)